MRNLLITNVFILFILIVPGTMLADATVVYALAFGALIAIVNTFVLMAHKLHADKRVLGMRGSIQTLYLCAFERLVLAALLFALGLGLFKLSPLFVITGFLVSQGVMVLESIARGLNWQHG